MTDSYYDIQKDQQGAEGRPERLCPNVSGEQLDEFLIRAKWVEDEGFLRWLAVASTEEIARWMAAGADD